MRRKGFSIIELSLVIAIAAVILGTALYSAGRIRQAALARRAVQELDALASASAQYYLGNGAYPAEVSDLRPVYLGLEASGVNPFGNAYTITSGISSVTVSTLLPKGLVTLESFGSQLVVKNQGTSDLVSVTKSIESATWGLQYDKKQIFRQ